MGPLQRTPGTAPTAFSQDPPWLRRRERNSLVKNRMREICTSGSVRDGDGDAPIYSAFALSQGGEACLEGCRLGEGGLVGEEVQPPGLVRGGQSFEEQAAEEAREHPHGEKEAGPAGNPALAPGLRRGRLWRQAAAPGDDMGVPMVGQW